MRIYALQTGSVKIKTAQVRRRRGGIARLFFSRGWPDWFSPNFIQFERQTFGPFEAHFPITEAGDVVVVPTPGHTPHHVSVIVRGESRTYFLAGDTTYDEQLLLGRQPDGVGADPDVTVDTIDRILRYAQSTPLLYLPSHDPGSADRLTQKLTTRPL